MLKSILQLLVFSNIYIAIGAACLSLITLLQIQQIGFHPIIIVVASSTCLAYIVFRLAGQWSDRKMDPAIFNSWVQRHLRFLRTLAVLTALASGLFFFQLRFQTQALILLAALLSALYILPLFPYRERSVGLREIWHWKTIIVAVVWSIVTVLAPISEFQSIGIEFTAILFLERFLFILGLTVPFDIRDLENDREQGLNTLTISYGVSTSKRIAYGLMIGFAGVAGIKLILMQLGILEAPNPPKIEAAIFYSAVIISIISMFIISKLDEERSEYWYTFLLDGMLILYFIIAFVLSSCSA